MGNTKSQQEKSEYQMGCFYEASEAKDCYLDRYKLLKNSVRPDQFYICKTLNPVQYDNYQTDVEEFSHRLTKSYKGFCEFCFIDPNPYNPDVYDMIFEFGSCLTNLNNEQTLWAFINDIARTLQMLEADGTHYPVIRKKYVCHIRQSRCFKLLNPFCFSAYNEDLVKIYMNPDVSIPDKRLYLRTKVNKSVREFGITILALVSGLEEAHFIQNPTMIKGKLDSMEDVYSEKLINLLRFLIETRGEINFMDVIQFIEKGNHPMFRPSLKRSVMSTRTFGQNHFADGWGQQPHQYPVTYNNFSQADIQKFASLPQEGIHSPLSSAYNSNFDPKEPTSFRNYDHTKFYGPGIPMFNGQGFPQGNQSVNPSNYGSFTYESDASGFVSGQGKRPTLYSPSVMMLKQNNNMPRSGYQADRGVKQSQELEPRSLVSPKPADEYLTNYNPTASGRQTPTYKQSNENPKLFEKQLQESTLSVLLADKRKPNEKSNFKITESELMGYTITNDEVVAEIDSKAASWITETRGTSVVQPDKITVPFNTPRTTVEEHYAPAPFMPKMKEARTESQLLHSGNVQEVEEPESPSFPQPKDELTTEAPPILQLKQQLSQPTLPVSQPILPVVRSPPLLPESKPKAPVAEEKTSPSTKKNLKVIKIRMKWQPDKNCHVEVLEFEDGSTEERPPRDQEMLKKIMEDFLRKKELEKPGEAPALNTSHIPKKSAMHQYDVSTLEPKNDTKPTQTLDSFNIRLFSPDDNATSRLIYTSEIKEMFDSFTEMAKIIDITTELRPSLYHNVEIDYFNSASETDGQTTKIKVEEGKEMKFEIRSLETHPYSVAGKQD